MNLDDQITKLSKTIANNDGVIFNKDNVINKIYSPDKKIYFTCNMSQYSPKIKKIRMFAVVPNNKKWYSFMTKKEEIKLITYRHNQNLLPLFPYSDSDDIKKVILYHLEKFNEYYFTDSSNQKEHYSFIKSLAPSTIEETKIGFI